MARAQQLPAPRDYGRSRSTILTDADLEQHLGYLSGCAGNAARRDRSLQGTAGGARRRGRPPGAAGGRGQAGGARLHAGTAGVPEEAAHKGSGGHADERRHRQQSSPRRRDDHAMVEEARGVAVAAADDVGLPFQADNVELFGAVKALDAAAYQRIRVI